MLNFPINEVIPKIKELLHNNSQLIIEAPAGAGKSTIVPISLLDEAWLENKKIIVLEPRRVATRAVATQMAKLLGQKVGQDVGYQIKMDSCFSEKTKILVVTEGVLVRKLQSDQALEDVACVIFDEFHERSIHTDLSLALSLQSQEMLREDLKIILMSATLNSEKLSNVLDEVKVVKSQGRMFDVEEIYLSDDKRHPNKDDINKYLLDTTLKAYTENQGDILIFLAGQKEINTLKALLENSIKDDILILPLHSNLNKNEQDLAINKNQKRKIILSTNLAQTSLTIEGITVVIDSGLEKQSRYDYTNGMDHLELSFISQDSAIQRQGRAGRLSEGKCYKLWHKKRLLEKEIKPEILRVDLSSFLLDVSLWGCESLEELVLLDIPKKQVIEESKKLLQKLEMLDEDSVITTLGKEAISLGLHPRLAFMLLKANTLGFAKEASLIASLLVEKDIFSRDYNSSDFIDRFEVVYENRLSSSYINTNRAKQVIKQSEFYLKRLEKLQKINKQSSFDKSKVAILLLFAYPDRLAKKRVSDDSVYALSNKKAAFLNSSDSLFKSEYLVVASLNAKQTNSYISQACKIEEKDIKKYFASHIKTKVLSSNSGEFQIREKTYFEDLLIFEQNAKNISKDEYVEALLDYMKNRGIEKIFEFDKKTKNLLSRLEFINTAKKNGLKCDLEIDSFSNEFLTSTVNIWLKPYLENIKKFDDLKKLDLYSILSSMISWNELCLLDELLPTHLSVPSGSKIFIDYSDDKNPILEVRIQEVFGMMETPRVLNNQISLTIHLLSPARRPIQITKDLKSFWQNSYEEVRKELRGKYKKHYWPENPYEAIATNKTKKNM